MRDAVVMLPGSGSDGDFMRRAFGPLLGSCRPVVVEHRSGRADLLAAELSTTLAQLTATDTDVAVVIGVSLGAHAAALWASRRPLISPDLVLALPAWTGAPGSVAAATAAAADQISRSGRDAELARLAQEYPDDWVVAELSRAWRVLPAPELVASLQGTAASWAPARHELQRIENRTAVLALADDPLHPVATARSWAAAIPRARLVEVGRQEPAGDLAVFGRRARAALEALRAG